MLIRAKRNTFLIKKLNDPNSDLVQVSQGKEYYLERFQESSLETDHAEYAKVELAFCAGIWHIKSADWKFPWSEKELSSTPTPPQKINWNAWSCQISKYFTVGEVTLFQERRIPTNPKIRQNAINLAKELDKVREWAGVPLIITSWYRPPDVERAVGGTGANHPLGLAADLRPKLGSIYEFQKKFEKEYYNTDRWQGGFGRGARKGFIHLDLRHKRIWDY